MRVKRQGEAQEKIFTMLMSNKGPVYRICFKKRKKERKSFKLLRKITTKLDQVFQARVYINGQLVYGKVFSVISHKGNVN